MDAFFVQVVLKIDPFGVPGLDQRLSGEQCSAWPSSPRPGELCLPLSSHRRTSRRGWLRRRSIATSAPAALRVAQNEEDNAAWLRANSGCSQAM